ncbi:MAG TPA: DNA recombination protein RmuC [Dongiaceae bacterium]|jgi:DNA recombination protein RmuC|nr:DNA recombination protein RmuC [Dongiaceae bacterium]
MELQDIAVWAAILVGSLALAFLAFGRRGADGGAQQLTGRLDQLAAQQAAAQNALSERLQAQERALATKLDERLNSLQDRVGQTLQSNAEQAGQTMTELRERLAVIDAAQKNIVELSSQVVDLQNVLSNKQARGAFGEVQLQDIVQSSLPAQSYTFQAQLGGKRVDCLLTLPNPPGAIGIDAKFPLEAYRALREAKDEVATAQARRDFTVAIRLHVKAIAEKYIVPGETADSALMFLPSEAVYAELHASFPNLVEEAGRARVWIVSPTTLMATLTTIRAVLKDVRMREQAHLIQKKVGELGVDVNRLGDRVDKLQRHFGQAVEDVRQIGVSSDKIAQKAAAIQDVEVGPTDGNITQIPEQPVAARLN